MRTVSAGGLALGALAAVLAAGISCLSVDEPSSSIPINACASAPCSQYGTSPSASCSEAGACEVAGSTSHLVLVISLPSDAPFDPQPHGAVVAPSAQYVIPYDHLADGNCPSGPASCDPGCVWPGCAVLPVIASETGGYLATAAIQDTPGPMNMNPNGIGFFLGNADPTTGVEDTLLPVTATYRMVQDPWMTPVSALGLPVQPVVAAQKVIVNGFRPFGPSHGPGYGFEAFLAPGVYERTVVPAPPYDAIFGPAIDEKDSVTVQSTSPDAIAISQFDPTMLIMPYPGHPILPAFNLSRSDGQSLDGWKAYLRSQSTGRVFTNVPTLSGTSVSGLQLLTFRGIDALTDAALVLQPRDGDVLPTAVFPVQGIPPAAELPATLTYPTLPPPISVTGTITGPGDVPIDADVEFEGLAFSDGAMLTDQNFEYTATAPARVSGSGTSTYTVTLPQGEYRVTVRPVSAGDTEAEAGASAPALLVTTLSVNDRNTLTPYPLLPMRTISRTVAIADGRPLVGATVEALPVSCEQPPSLVDGGDAGSPLKQIGTTAACLPRPQQVLVTDSAGTFYLPLDPGGYELRVRPADGTGFPWVTQPLDPSAAGTVRVVVPAPFHASFKLVDANNDTPLVRALVKAFLLPDASSSAPAVELGETLTDGSGQCDLYLDLALPP